MRSATARKALDTMIKSQFANVVIVPVNFRVDIASQIWLVKNGLVKEESSGFFTPVAVQCEDDSVEVLVLPNRIQITSKLPSMTDALLDAAERMTRFIDVAGSALTPIEGIGVNCQVVLETDDLDGIRRVYFTDSGLLRASAEGRDLSFTLAETIALGRLTTKVQYAKHIETGEMGLVMDFNCHADAAESGQVLEFLGSVKDIAEICGDRVQVVRSDIAQQGGV